MYRNRTPRIAIALPESGPVWPPAPDLASAGATILLHRDAELLALLLAGACDAALLPPENLLDAPMLRIVPGIGILLAHGDAPPQVLRVWACRHRAPYPVIRAVLAQAHQAASANPDLAHAKEYSYLLASAGAESLRRLAMRLRPDTHEQLFHFC